MEGVQGGNVLHGAMMGLLSAGSGEGMMALGGSLKTGMKVALQSVIGGTLSELGGGNFANGAITAAFSFLFNHTMHEREMRKQKIEEDGRLSFAEAYGWYSEGNGESITVDAEKLDLNQFIGPECFEIGKITSLYLLPASYGKSQLLTDSQILQGLVYGSITIEYLGNNQFKIHTDNYGFEMHNNPKHAINVFLRNIETFGAHLLHGQGTSFDIHFRGVYQYKTPESWQPKIY